MLLFRNGNKIDLRGRLVIKFWRDNATLFKRLVIKLWRDNGIHFKKLVIKFWIDNEILFKRILPFQIYIYIHIWFVFPSQPYFKLTIQRINYVYFLMSFSIFIFSTFDVSSPRSSHTVKQKSNENCVKMTFSFPHGYFKMKNISSKWRYYDYTTVYKIWQLLMQPVTVISPTGPFRFNMFSKINHRQTTTRNNKAYVQYLRCVQTSHERHVIPNYQQRDYLFNSLFCLTRKKT